MQPKWRDTSKWPFAQEGIDGRDWGSLADGGKDGLFLTLVSLGWWVLACDPSKDSEVDKVIKDVTWVISKLVSSLSEAATMMDSPDSPSALPRGKRPTPTNIPAGCTKHSRA